MSKSLYLGSSLVSIGGAAPQDEGWQRPSEWLALPPVSPSEDKIVALMAVASGSSVNYGALTFLGGVDVDWGDGTSSQAVSRPLRAEATLNFTATEEIESLNLQQIKDLYFITYGGLMLPEFEGISDVYDYTLVYSGIYLDGSLLEEDVDYTISGDTITFLTSIQIDQNLQVSVTLETYEPSLPFIIESVLYPEANTFEISYEEIWANYVTDAYGFLGFLPYSELVSLLSSTYTLGLYEVQLDNVPLEEGVDYNVVDGVVVFENEILEGSNVHFKIISYGFGLNISNSDVIGQETFPLFGNGIVSDSVPYLALQYDNEDAEIYSVVENAMYDGLYLSIPQEYWSDSKTILMLSPTVADKSSNYYSSIKHEYDFSSLDPETEFTENGETYRQAIVQITPLSGYSIEEIVLIGRETIVQPAYTNVLTYVPNYLDVVISLPNAQKVYPRTCPQSIQCNFLNLGNTAFFTIYRDDTIASSVLGGDYLSIFRLKKFLMSSDKFVSISDVLNNAATLQEIVLNISGACLMSASFRECFLLKKVSGDISSLFYGAPFADSYSLIDLSLNFNTLNNTSLSNIFSSLTRLERVSTIDLSNIIEADYLFYNCPSLQNVTLTNTSSVENWYFAFYNCQSLREIELDLSSAVNCDYMFFVCRQIQKVTLLNSSTVSSWFVTFAYCNSLKEINADWSSASDTTEVFNGCFNLQKLNITNIGKNFSDGGQLFLTNTSLNRDALINVFNDLTDISENLQGASVLYMDITNTLGTPDLTESDLEIATNKGWVILID